MRIINIIVLVIVSAWLSGCGPQLYVPVSTDPVELQQLRAGRKLYVNHCGNCHNLHLPKEYSADLWKIKVNAMQGKAKIGEEEKRLILQFLTSQH